MWPHLPDNIIEHQPDPRSAENPDNNNHKNNFFETTNIWQPQQERQQEMYQQEHWEHRQTHNNSLTNWVTI